jgi:hypothetical protein
MNPRMRWLLAALAAVLVATFWPQDPDGEPEVVDVARRPLRQASGHAAAPRPVVSGAMSARLLGDMEADLFPVQTWQPPPPKPQPVALPPPPPPAPPPLPFKYLGRWAEAGSEVVFLGQGERVLSARMGDTLAGSWRVDEISPGRMTLTYLPLNMQQTLRIAP